jgi:hypothetical protein
VIVSINQPAYLPWLGYFHRIAASDLHVVLDHVQFEKNSFVNRNKMRTAKGWTWLTVPVKTKGHFGDLSIEKLEIDSRRNWRGKHLATLEQTYARAPYMAEYSGFLEDVLSREWDHLVELCRYMTGFFLEALKIETPLVESSTLPVDTGKSKMVLDLCREMKATTYLSGAMGKDYLDEDMFKEAGIKVVYQDYRHPVYTQCQPGEIIPFMGILDLLLNHGPESRDILMGGQETLPVTG